MKKANTPQKSLSYAWVFHMSEVAFLGCCVGSGRIVLAIFFIGGYLLTCVWRALYLEFYESIDNSEKAG